MKKKLFATLGVLCLGVILCVSTVFAAVNWWYSVNDDDANPTTIQFGQKITLSVENAADASTGVYQKSTVTFKTVTVKAPAWTPEGGANHDQTTMPTFNLVLNVKEVVDEVEQDIDPATLDFITVSTTVNATPYEGELGGAILEDIQTIQGNAASFDATIVLTFGEEISDTFANRILSFQLTIELVEPAVAP